MKGKQLNSKQTIFRGIVTPMGWDENGKVDAIGLSGTDEKQYLIEKNEKQGELFRLIQMEVELRGLLREHSDNRTILVKRWHKISRVTPRQDQEKGGDN